MLFWKLAKSFLLFYFFFISCLILPVDKLEVRHFFGFWKIDLKMMEQDLEQKKKQPLTKMEKQVWESTKKFLSGIELDISKDSIKKTIGKKISKDFYQVVVSKTSKEQVFLKITDKKKIRFLRKLNEDFTSIEYSVFDSKGEITERLFLLRR